jgi:hypothetical protein
VTDSEHPNPPLRPLTADEFNAGAANTRAPIPIVEDEAATHVYAYGHVDKQAMADAVTALDHEACGQHQDCLTDIDDVRHTYAVTLTPADDLYGWWISWDGVEAETPGSFPITLVAR